MKQNTTFKIILLAFCLLSGTQIWAQIKIKEINGVYKSKIDGRIISNDEFQSYRGVYTFHKLIRGKNGAKDTLLISPPTDKKRAKEKAKKVAFSSQVGKSMSSFSATDLYGNPVNSETLKGKVIVMNFWFVACAPCVKEMPELNDLVAKYKNRDDVVFIGPATDTSERLGNFLAKTQFDYQIIPLARDIAKTYKVYGYPSNFVINKKGIVSYAHMGLDEKSLSNLEKAIEDSL